MAVIHFFIFILCYYLCYIFLFLSYVDGGGVYLIIRYQKRILENKNLPEFKRRKIKYDKLITSVAGKKWKYQNNHSS